MNKIILSGIDFSDCSINALEHAISIANKSQADVAMIWVNRPENGKEIYIIDQENIVSEAIQRFEKLVEKYQPQLLSGHLSYQIRKGKVYQEIVRAADEMDAFLIVIGTHGSSGFEEFWIGSNANRIVTSTERPIITIRGGVDISRTIRKIVMPIDSTIESRQKVPMTTLLAKYFDAEIYVIAVFTSPAKEVRDMVKEYVSQVERYLVENMVHYNIKEIEADNLTNATIDYAIKVGANLISIMDEQETTTSNLWLGPYAQQMVNHSPIPVLCIHAKDLISSISR
ncbi:MAG: universal stress protein [Bacteroidales bacterium]|nr:universal stress protein [Bacteroidales bacterium]MDP2236547.1 universal stress protein [Bacteroidales bacterium]